MTQAEVLKSAAHRYVESFANSAWSQGEISDDIGCHRNWAGICTVEVVETDEPVKEGENWIVTITASVSRWETSTVADQDQEEYAKSEELEEYFVTLDNKADVLELAIA